MSNVLFDEEKFCNYCCKPCNDGRRLLLAKIEQYKESEPEMVRQLGWYRDQLWRDQIKDETFRQLRDDKKEDKTLNKDMATALRAMADKLEQPGSHFMISGVLPPLPIFSGGTDKDCYFSSIEVLLVKGPLGG